MLTASARRRVAALRQPGTAARIARALWIAWAVIVWNVVFDHVIVMSGRRYIYEAGRAARVGKTLSMDDWMRPAVTRGLWIATASASGILIVGLASVRAAAARAETPHR